MKKQILIAFIMMVAFAVPALQAQTSQKSYEVVQKNESGSAAFIKFIQPESITLANVWDLLREDLHLGANDKMKLTRTSVPDQLGFTHYRYQQYHKGLEVWGAEYILHLKNGTFSTANGNVIGGLKLPTKARLNEKTALEKALKHLGKTKYRWQDPAAEKDLKKKSGKKNATYYPKGKLIIAPVAGNMDAIKNFRLCWTFDIAGSEMHDAWIVFVDATTGEIINTISSIQTTDLK